LEVPGTWAAGMQDWCGFARDGTWYRNGGAIGGSMGWCQVPWRQGCRTGAVLSGMVPGTGGRWSALAPELLIKLGSC
jgi:hypothetical protein